ncbi:MAG: HAMP domain-containing sensor histidine kinase [Myxococcota bacterium]
MLSVGSDGRNDDPLRREVLSLNEQVKQLVRTEHRLSLWQQRLDGQLERVEALNRLSLQAGEATEPATILVLALDAMLALFSYEQAIAFLRQGEAYVAVARRNFLSDGDGTTRNDPAPVSSPPTPQDIHEPLLDEDAPWLKPFHAAWAASLLRGEDGSGGPCLALPVSSDRMLALLLFRRGQHLTSPLEVLPQRDDLPFLRLFGAHVAGALRNLLLYREAQEAIRFRDEFLMLASHELKTPLTTSLLLFQSLRKHDRLQCMSAANAESLERQILRLNALVEQLLDVSRIRHGRFAPRRKDADLVQLTREVIWRFRFDAEQKGSSVSLSAPASVVVSADAAQIDQVLANLLSNAIKFGEGRPIQVNVDVLPERAQVRVHDSGIGIPAADQARVFQCFERAVSLKNFGGLGLGLYISKRIAEAHGGGIGVESSVESGTTFTLWLPRQPTICPGPDLVH